MEIIFVRHGQSTANLAGELGTTFDYKNIVLTEKGEKQAYDTGKFLSKIFGKFDIVYSSPIKRCIQTTKNIQKNINECEFVISDLLVEIGETHHNLDGLNPTETRDFIDKNGKLKDYEQEIKNEINSFNKLKLQIKLGKEQVKYFEVVPSINQGRKNYKKFLKALTKLDKDKYKQVLVVAHSGSIEGIYKIISSININNDFAGLTELNNCSIMCVLLHNNNKFELVSKPSSKHLD